MQRLTISSRIQIFRSGRCTSNLANIGKNVVHTLGKVISSIKDLAAYKLGALCYSHE